MRKYDRYKDSHLAGVSQIPVHWEVHRSKNLFREVDERSATGEETLFSLTQKHGLVDRSTVTDRQHAAATLEGYKICRAGNLVMNRMQAWNGMFGLADGTGLVSPDYTVLRPVAAVNERFYEYLFRTPLYASEFRKRSKGVGEGFLRLYTPDFYDIRVAVPPLEEQQAISSYLEEKTEDIDRFIAAKQQLIARLEEQRAALINRAVTKGLDPDVPMKPSGVAWLGEIPAHWRQIRLKYLVHGIVDTEHKTCPEDPEGEYLVVRTSNVRDGRLMLDDVYYTDQTYFEEWTRRGVPRPGDILFTREAPAGEACLVPDDLPLCLGQRMVWIQVDRDLLHPQYAMYVLNSNLTDDFIKVTGRGATVDHFNMSDIGKIPFVIPSLGEQIDIVEYVKPHYTTNERA